MRRNKFNAVPTVVDGIRFASKAEAKRYGELKLLERAKQITHLARQPRFPLDIHGVVIGNYTGDFSYREPATETPFRTVVVEDVKGKITEAAALRMKVFAAIYQNHELRIIGGKRAKAA